VGWSAVFHVEKMENAESILRLMHVKTSRITVELNTKVPLNGTEIVGLECAVKMIIELSDETKIASCDKDVINID